MDNLVAGVTDIALGRWDQFPPGVSARVLMSDSLAVALPRGHRLAQSESVRFSDIAHEPFVSLPYAAGSITTDRLWRFGFASNTRIDNVQFAPDTQSCIALVSAEVGCHLALSSVGRWATNPDVVFVPLAAQDAERVPDVHLRAAWQTNDVPASTAIALDYLAQQRNSDNSEQADAAESVPNSATIAV